MNRIQTSKIYPWVVVALLWVVALLNYMDRQMLSTMRDAMQFDITELESAVNFGRLMAIFLWIYGFMSPVAGAVADRISRKWLIVVSLGVWSTVTLLMGYSTTFTQIYWLRALMGVSEALYIPAGLSLIADYFTGSRRSLAIGIHMTGLYVGQAVGGFGATVAAAFVADDLPLVRHRRHRLCPGADPAAARKNAARGPNRRSTRPSPPGRPSGGASRCSSRISPSGRSSSTSPRRRCRAGRPRTGSRRSSPRASASRCRRQDRSRPSPSPFRRSWA